RLQPQGLSGDRGCPRQAGTRARAGGQGGGLMTETMPYQHLGEALGTDYFLIREQLDDEQWDFFMRARRFVDKEVLPAINEYWEAAEFPWPLARRLGELGLVGDDI